MRKEKKESRKGRVVRHVALLTEVNPQHLSLSFHSRSVCSLLFKVFSCQLVFFFFSSRRRHTIFSRDWSSDVCSSDLRRRGHRSRCRRRPEHGPGGTAAGR